MTARPPRQPRPAVMLTVAQAADRLGFDDPRQVYYYISAGLLAAVRYPPRNGRGGGPLRIEETAVDAFIAGHRQEARAS